MTEQELKLAKLIQDGGLSMGHAKITWRHYRAVMRYYRNYPEGEGRCFAQNRATRQFLSKERA